jgi:SAM-dependent methyltransferase
VTEQFLAEWRGHCPICKKSTIFRAENPWFRDNLICMSCEGGSIPRERALMHVLETECPDWRTARIHESSPVFRATSLILRRECKGYVPTYFFPDATRGEMHNGSRCEDIERQTFGDESLDIVITQDVMEHIFDPESAYKDIWRTLRPGGLHIHTTPINKSMVESVRCAERLPDGSIKHLTEPSYHGNPIDDAGSLVTFLWGYDLPDLIAKWAQFDVEVRRFNDASKGIVAEYSEVIICHKRV